MARNPYTVKKAQKQLDDVLGGERLPEHSDMDQLPYIAAIVKETMRWAPPLPLGSAHRLMEDDIYKGMFIPAGSTVMENIWSVHSFTRGRTSLTCRAGEYLVINTSTQTQKRSTQRGFSLKMGRSTHQLRIQSSWSLAADGGRPNVGTYGHTVLNATCSGFAPGDTLLSETCALLLLTSSPHLTFSLLSMRVGTRNHL